MTVRPIHSSLIPEWLTGRPNSFLMAAPGAQRMT